MQNIYPEGYIFIHALYGLSWSDFIQSLPKEHPKYKEGLEELDRVTKALLSPKAKYIFDETLHLKYGAYYMGWSTYLLGKKLSAQDLDKQPKEELEEFKRRCRMIVYALETQESPYLESYSGQAWPADGLIAVSAVQLYNTKLGGQLQNEVENWLVKVKKNLDHKYHLIPHSINGETGEILESARGCSQSLMLNFLQEIDPVFAKEQFEKYRKLFVDKRLGLYGIREYPIGITGSGDVDSGPVIWDIGGAASIVGQRAFGMYGDTVLYKALRNNIEAFGMGFKSQNKKSYLFGQIPMMDAFFAWSNSLENPTWEKSKSNTIYWKFHGISGVIILGLLWGLFKINRN